MESLPNITVRCLNSNSTFAIELPATSTVQRVKELLLQFHPMHPPVLTQKLVFRGELLRDSDRVYPGMMEDPFYLTVSQENKQSENPYGSEAFLHREKEYISNYKKILATLSKTGNSTIASPVITGDSPLNYLPICHPEMQKRVSALYQKPKKIRLHSLRWSRLIDFSLISRNFMFLIIAVIFKQRLSPIIAILMAVVYLIEVRRRIAKHRETQLRRLPQEYLRLVMPGEYVQPERRGHSRFRKLIEIGRSFYFSLLPWFNPRDYTERRARELGD